MGNATYRLRRALAGLLLLAGLIIATGIGPAEFARAGHGDTHAVQSIKAPLLPTVVGTTRPIATATPPPVCPIPTSTPSHTGHFTAQPMGPKGGCQ
jgi:hypothetical protein